MSVKNDYGQDAPLKVVYWDATIIADMNKVGPSIPYYAKCIQGLPQQAELVDARLVDGKVAFVFLCVDWDLVAQGESIPEEYPRFYLDKVVRVEPEYRETPVGRLIGTIP